MSDQLTLTQLRQELTMTIPVSLAYNPKEDYYYCACI